MENNCAQPELVMSTDPESDLLQSPQGTEILKFMTFKKIVRALAGPMTRDQAEKFCRRVTPVRSKRDFK